MTETNLKDSIKELNSKIDELVEKKQAKKWNIPFMSRLSSAKVKKNWVTVCYLQENKSVSFMRVPIDEGVIMLNGIPHTVNADEILIHKNKPFLIVPSWSIKPFSPTQNLKETNEAGNSTLGWEYIMNYMRKTEIKAVKNFGVVAWIIGAAVIIGGIYYIFKSGIF